VDSYNQNLASNDIYVGVEHVAYAYFIDLAGAVVIIIAAIIIAIFNRPIPNDDVTVAFTSLPAPVTGHNACGMIDVVHCMRDVIHCMIDVVHCFQPWLVAVHLCCFYKHA
jgi:predicted membrane-bound mannosyltransferase